MSKENRSHGSRFHHVGRIYEEDDIAEVGVTVTVVIDGAVATDGVKEGF